MIRFASASPGARAAAVALGGLSALSLLAVLAVLIALVGLGQVSGAIEPARVPGWLPCTAPPAGPRVRNSGARGCGRIAASSWAAQTAASSSPTVPSTSCSTPPPAPARASAW